jgi:HSP20 family protein
LLGGFRSDDTETQEKEEQDMAFGTLMSRQCARDATLAHRDLSRLANEFVAGFGLPHHAIAPERRARFAPAVEAVELPDAYRVRAELPGVAASDIEVLVEDGAVTIKARRQGETEAETEAADGTEHRVERFERRLRFGAEIAEEGVTAAYKNGLLTVSVPKKEEEKPEVRKIPVQAA